MAIEGGGSSARAISPEVRPHPGGIVGEQAIDSQRREVVGKAAGLMVVDSVDEDRNFPRSLLCDPVAPQGLGRTPLAIADRLGTKALCRRVEGLRSDDLGEIGVGAK